MITLEVPAFQPPSSRKGWFAFHPFLRWALFLGGGFITLIALAYTIENWRGKRAWQQYKQDAEARGIPLDWNAYIPPPVPDDQNAFKAPNMQLWFTGRGMRENGQHIPFANFQRELLEHSASASVTVLPANARVAPESADIVLRYNPPLLTLAGSDDSAPIATPSHSATNASPPHVQVEANALKELQKWIQQKVDAMGQPEPHPHLDDVNGIPVTRQTLPIIPPLRVVVLSDSAPSLEEVREFFPTNPRVTYYWSSGVLASGSNTFRIPLAPLPYIPAADYIQMSDVSRDDFDAIRAALERPYARMEGDYERPAAIPIPNFVRVRQLAQTLALRAQCYLLLGEPENALHELTLINDLSRLLEGKPTGKPMTLVAAMINVAVKGLYVAVIADGLRLHAWREPELAALQAQLAQTDLPPFVHDAFLMETVSFGRMVESYDSRELAESFHGDSGTGLWQELHDPMYAFARLAPRGWLYQNAARRGALKQVALDGFDSAHHVIMPRKVDQLAREAEDAAKHVSPYNFVALKLLPNFTRAMQVAARNQTLLNEALVACALERHHLAHGRYPETLDALVSRFAAKLPADLMGGGPLKYRNEGARFLLYSIGWNEKDDGGVPSWKDDLTGDVTQNDWTWPYQEKNAN